MWRISHDNPKIPGAVWFNQKSKKVDKVISLNMSRADIESAGIQGANSKNEALVLNDFVLYTDAEEQSVGRWLSNEGYWEAWITSWMTKNIKPGFICLDIGANYGYYTRIMERLSGPSGSVYAFEANKQLSNMISKSIVDYPINNGSPVTVFSIAVTDKKGTVTLNIPPKYLGGSSIVWGNQELPSDIPNEEWTGKQEVDSDTIDHLLELKNIDLIKIDIEGAEPLAWKGMQKALEVADTVVMEFGTYLPAWFIDEVFSKYQVKYINNSGDEELLPRSEFDKLTDLVMVVLRK